MILTAPGIVLELIPPPIRRISGKVIILERGKIMVKDFDRYRDGDPDKYIREMELKTMRQVTWIIILLSGITIGMMIYNYTAIFKF